MRWRADLAIAGLIAAVAIAGLVPATGQRAPQSILPPGFGEGEPPPPKAPAKTPPPEKSAPRSGEDNVPEIPLAIPKSVGTPPPSSLEDALDNASEALPVPVTELAPEIRRSIEGVGLLAEEDGGLAANAWGASDGRFLNGVAMRMRAPIASRWLSIVLRRALLSRTATPANIAPADWIATRAWLLVRMGEADNARALVEGVDSGNQTPWLSTVTMQAALATADPAAMCGIADTAAQADKGPAWLLARAMCAGLSGESGTASALVDQARDTRRARGIDVLLVQKVMGVGSNARRATNIQWDGVQKLNVWRFGLATATGVTIPERLLTTTGPQVRAWLARAPLVAPAARAASADLAAAMGVFSSAALVDLYASIYDESDPSERTGTVANTLRTAYTGDPSTRLAALHSLWSSAPDNRWQSYSRLILGARAAVAIAPSQGADAADDVVAAMMSAGLDLQAERWSAAATTGSRAWALLAVGAPRTPPAVSSSAIAGYRSGDAPLHARFLFAGLAGLGRISANDAEDLARSLEVPIGRASAWSQALDTAVASRATATVVLLCAAGLQARDWRDVPPAHLYRIVAALRTVGLEPEARMIAAEALTRA